MAASPLGARAGDATRIWALSDVVPGTGDQFRLRWHADWAGRDVWIEVEATDDSEPGYGRRFRSPALRFDSRREVIEWVEGERRTLCARTERRGWGVFRNVAVVPTGNCLLGAEPVYIEFDNGFRVVRGRGERLVLRVLPTSDDTP